MGTWFTCARIVGESATVAALSALAERCAESCLATFGAVTGGVSLAAAESKRRWVAADAVDFGSVTLGTVPVVRAASRGVAAGGDGWGAITWLLSGRAAASPVSLVETTPVSVASALCACRRRTSKLAIK